MFQRERKSPDWRSLFPISMQIVLIPSIVEQIAFGPRVPNTEAHRHCSDYLIAGLKRFGAAVQVQEAILTAYNGDRLNARNIIRFI